LKNAGSARHVVLVRHIEFHRVGIDVLLAQLGRRCRALGLVARA
jgi:hypothetical protein